VIAWAVFIYSFVYYFVLAFVGVIIWNIFSPWSLKVWSVYFMIVSLVIPSIIAIISTFWFSIGGVIAFPISEHKAQQNAFASLLRFRAASLISILRSLSFSRENSFPGFSRVVNDTNHSPPVSGRISLNLPFIS
jgi:hypothetical protein